MLSFAQVVILLFWLSIIFPYPIYFVLFYRHRFIHPIKGRAPRVTLLQGFVILIFGTDIFVSEMFPHNCRATQWFLFWSSTWMTFCFAYRLIQLVFNYEITQNIAELKGNRKLGDWKSSWFTTHRWLAQDRFMIRLAISIFVAFTLYVIIWEAAGLPVCNSSAWNDIYIGIAIVWIIFCLILASRTWKYPPDAFGIKWEFKCVVGGTLGMVLFFIILSALAPNYPWILQIGLISACHPYLIFTLVVPYYRTNKQILLTKMEVAAELGTLDAWLARPEGVKLFLDYLKTEFSSENLLFYLDVAYLKNLGLGDVEGVKDEMQSIYLKFFEGTSPCALNLPHELLESTANQVQHLRHMTHEDLLKMDPQEILGVFDASRREIYNLMNADSFRRFQQSEAYSKISHAGGSTGSGGDAKAEMDQLFGSQKGLMSLVSELRGDTHSQRGPASPSKDSILHFDFKTSPNKGSPEGSHASQGGSSHAGAVDLNPSTPKQHKKTITAGRSFGPDSPSIYEDSRTEAVGGDNETSRLRGDKSAENSRLHPSGTEQELTTPKKLRTESEAEPREIDLENPGPDSP